MMMAVDINCRKRIRQSLSPATSKPFSFTTNRPLWTGFILCLLPLLSDSCKPLVSLERSPRFDLSKSTENRNIPLLDSVVRVRGGGESATEEANAKESKEEGDSRDDGGVVVQDGSSTTNINDKEGEEGVVTEAGADAAESASALTLTSEAADQELQEQAQALRQRGKEFHDEGDYGQAAEVFQQASELLATHYQNSPTILSEYCTCRLHEALCRLKVSDYEGCVEVCSSLLNDDELLSNDHHNSNIGMIRARAHHRRAKAYLCLGEDSLALQDARSAAFLGDRRAVALYGKLMRDTNNSTSSSLDVETPASSVMLQELFQGKNPFLDDSSSSSSSALGNNPLLSSLLTKSPLADGGAGGFPAAFLKGSSSNSGKGNAKLVQSIVKKLTNKLTDDADNICSFLQSTNPAQLQQWAALAGMPLSDSQARRLVQFCHAVTPKRITSTVSWSKRLWYVVGVTRKTLRLIQKYRQVLILLAIVLWIQSALTRPIPINKKAALAAATAAATTTTTPQP